MTSYQRGPGGHPMTVHAPRPGEFDPNAFAAFAGGDPVLGLDVETSAIPDSGPRFFAPGFTLRLVQLGTEHEAWVLDMTDPAQRDAAAAALASPARRFVTHTAFDVLAVWAALGIPLGQRVADTHLLSKLLDPDERAGHGLKELSARHLDTGLTDAEAALHARMRELAPVGHRAGNAWLRWGWDHMPADDEAYAVYAGLDAIYARRLLSVLLAACGPFAHLAVMDTWLAAQATGITIRGLRLDGDYTRRLLGELEAEHTAAEAVITGALGCPGGSPKVADWLAAQCATAGISGLAATPGGRMQVTADALTALLDRHAAALPADARGVAAARLAMSRASNLIANLRGFLAAAGADGRVHPQVNTLRAKTARMSITGPALQTLKKHDGRLRRCFTADAGHVLISCDFSQVEVRVAAALAGDPTLRDVILSGTDIHDATARLMYGPGFTDEQRTISKRATFGTIYGGGARALAGQTGVAEEVARQVIDRWRSTYPRVIAYGRRLAALPEVITASGRRIPADPGRPYANANYAVQSTARDLLLAAAYALVTRHRVGGLWLFVHDEIIVQAPEHEAEHVRALIEEAMTSTFRSLPIVAEAKILGPSWGHAGKPAAKEAPAAHSTTPDNTMELAPEGVAMTAAPSPARRVRTLDIALWCAARGWHVLPLRSTGKQPAWHRADRCPGTGDCASGHVSWEARATADPARVRRLFARSGPDAPLNVGIAAGPSGLIVLDLDVPKRGQAPPPQWAEPGINDGADVLASLCERHGEPFPFETFVTRTRRGGMHLYFTPPPGTRLGCTAGGSAGGLGWLIDTRAHGGYVVAPGCYVADDDGAGWYEAIYQRPPAELPGWLERLLAAPAVTSPLECHSPVATMVRDLNGYASRALKGELQRVVTAAEGGRNAALNKAAYYLGQLIGAGVLTEELAVTELAAAASVHYGPSFTAGGAADTIRSALAAGKRAPRRIAA
jgi:DNA polymerase-1